MKALITQCTDQHLWYANLVGKSVDVIRELPAEQCWLSREPAGYANIVHYQDGIALPHGFDLAANDTHIQRHDLVLVGRRWHLPRLEQIGTPVANQYVIRHKAANDSFGCFDGR